MKNIALVILSSLLFASLLKADEIDFKSRTYTVVSVRGTFGTYGMISDGDILIFNPQELLKTKPPDIFLRPKKSPAEDVPNASYLVLEEGNFELSQTSESKYAEHKSYSFTSTGRLSKIRFDVVSDRQMFIVWESESIVYGIIYLDCID